MIPRAHAFGMPVEAWSRRLTPEKPQRWELRSGKPSLKLQETATS
jgi:hypothetical protein